MKTKTHPIVMLPTEKASLIGKFIDTSQLVFNNPNHSDIPRGEFQHLYILSDEEIKEGDYYFNNYRKVILKCESLMESKNTSIHSGIFLKIIATTDESLKGKQIGIGIDEPIYEELPQITESFIKQYITEYNEGKPITEVELEYYITHETDGDKSLCLKTTSNNEVIISLPDFKTFTYNQVLDFVTCYSGMSREKVKRQFDKWLINGNL